MRMTAQSPVWNNGITMAYAPSTDASAAARIGDSAPPESGPAMLPELSKLVTFNPLVLPLSATDSTGTSNPAVPALISPPVSNSTVSLTPGTAVPVCFGSVRSCHWLGSLALSVPPIQANVLALIASPQGLIGLNRDFSDDQSSCPVQWQATQCSMRFSTTGSLGSLPEPFPAAR